MKNPFKSKFTVILIPHYGKRRPVRTNISLGTLSFIAAVLICSVGIAVSAVMYKINYAEIQNANRFLQETNVVLNRELRNSFGTIKQIASLDSQLKGYLKMENPRDIIEAQSQNKIMTMVTGIETRNPLNPPIITTNDARIQTHTLKQEAWRLTASLQDVYRIMYTQSNLLSAKPNIRPAVGRITSGFGFRTHPVLGGNDLHLAVDIANAKGTPIYATADGVVVIASWQRSYGQMVMIDHGYGFATRYGHASKMLVKPGDFVKRGQVIALMGDTGRATASHVHYEVWYNGKPINPTHFFGKS